MLRNYIFYVLFSIVFLIISLGIFNIDIVLGKNKNINKYIFFILIPEIVLIFVSIMMYITGDQRFYNIIFIVISVLIFLTTFLSYYITQKIVYPKFHNKESKNIEKLIYELSTTLPKELAIQNVQMFMFDAVSNSRIIIKLRTSEPEQEVLELIKNFKELIDDRLKKKYLIILYLNDERISFDKN